MGYRGSKVSHVVGAERLVFSAFSMVVASWDREVAIILFAGLEQIENY